jgi:hypothetical protein
VQLFDDAGSLESVVAAVNDITEETEPARREIIAESQAMRDVLSFVRRAAVSEAASILIEGAKKGLDRQDVAPPEPPASRAIPGHQLPLP